MTWHSGQTDGLLKASTLHRQVTSKTVVHAEQRFKLACCSRAVPSVARMRRTERIEQTKRVRTSYTPFT